MRSKRAAAIEERSRHRRGPGPGVVLLFITLTIGGIAIVQRLLAQWFAEFDWPAELQYHGSFLVAILIVGGVAEVVRRRMGIEMRR